MPTKVKIIKSSNYFFKIFLLLLFLCSDCNAHETKEIVFIRDMVNQIRRDRSDFLKIMKNLTNNNQEYEYALGIYNDYNEISNELNSFNNYLYLYSLVDRIKKEEAKIFINSQKYSLFTLANITKEDILNAQTYTKLPVIYNYGEKLKDHLNKIEIKFKDPTFLNY